MLRGNRLLANVENQLQKTSLLEIEKHRGGQKNTCPRPPPTAEHTQMMHCLERKHNCYVVAFTFTFTGKRQ